jgi:type II secretory pathway pseudopilin PulG
MLRLNARNKSRGFTLAEQLVIVAVMGVLVLLAVPNFMGVLDRVKLDQAITDVRGALQESQRQAIRLSQACVVTLNFARRQASGPCLVTGNRTFPERVEIVTNIKPTKEDGDDKDKGKGNDKIGIQLTFGVLGTAEFQIESTGSSGDPSGKIVFYLPKPGNKDQKCIAISNTLGLTRVGVYSGSLKNSQEISDGMCTASE